MLNHAMGQIQLLAGKKSTGWAPEADRVDHPGAQGDAASVDVSEWDIASIGKGTATALTMSAGAPGR